MSLKAFHIFFISLVTCFSAAFAWWSWSQHSLGVEGPYLVLALCGAVLAVGLAVYGVWFLQKMRTVSFL